MSSVEDDLDLALSILRSTGDIVVERPSSAEVPAWAAERGWDGFLCGLGDEDLFTAEREPASWLQDRQDAPPRLRELARTIRSLTRRYEDQGPPRGAPHQRHVRERKRTQLQALSEVATERFSDARRVIDFGAGNGHLTRELARTLGCESIGIDWDAARVARASHLGGSAGPRFLLADGVTSTLVLEEGDLVVGLHPCGSLGDALVARARDARAHVLAVSCCFQKIANEERSACSERAKGFTIPKHALGLANLSPVSFEGSGDLAAKREGRRTRLALRLALEARGEQVAPGAEARGVPKERVRRGLREIADLAFEARGLDTASDADLEAAAAAAAAQYGHIARFALPRHALSRVLELAIVLDRACLLAEGGFAVEVRPLFSSRTSPRNLGIVARAR